MENTKQGLKYNWITCSEKGGASSLNILGQCEEGNSLHSDVKVKPCLIYSYSHCVRCVFCKEETKWIPRQTGGVSLLFCYNSHWVGGVNNPTSSRLVEWVSSVNIIALSGLRGFLGTLMVLSGSSDTLFNDLRKIQLSCAASYCISSRQWMKSRLLAPASYYTLYFLILSQLSHYLLAMAPCPRTQHLCIYWCVFAHPVSSAPQFSPMVYQYFLSLWN